MIAPTDAGAGRSRQQKREQHCGRQKNRGTYDHAECCEHAQESVHVQPSLFHPKILNQGDGQAEAGSNADSGDADAQKKHQDGRVDQQQSGKEVL